MVDLQNGVLLHHAEEHEDAERGVEIERVARVPEREHGERHRQRQRQQDGQRVDEAFELRGENHVHEGEREHEDPQELGEGLLHLLRLAGDEGRVGRRQVHRRHLALDRVDPVRLAEARGDACAQAHLALPVRAVDARGRGRAHNLHEVVEAHEAAARRQPHLGGRAGGGVGRQGVARHVEARDHRQVVAVGVEQPHRHVVVIVDVVVVEARDLIITAHHQAQRRRDLLGVHAQVGGARAVDDDTQLRLVELQSTVDVRDAAQLTRPELQGFAVLGELLEVGTAQGEIDVEGATADVEPRDVSNLRPVAVGEELTVLLPQGGDDLALRVVAAEGGQRVAVPDPVPDPVQAHRPLRVRHRAHVHVALVDPVEEAAARGGQRERHTLRLARLLGEGLHPLVHGGQAHPLGAEHEHLELGLVHVARDVLLLHGAIDRHRRGQHHHAHDHDDPAMAHRPRQAGGVGRVDIAIKTPPRRGLVILTVAASVLRAQKPCTHHRRQRERHEQADHDRHGGREAELVEEPARDRRHERHRHEDHDERERRRHHRQADVRGGLARGVEGLHLLFFHEAEDVFEHHDGVVDDDADHQHQRQHGHAIEREVQHPHHPEGRDDRGRDGHRRDERRAPRAHEGQHDQRREDRAEHEVQADLVQRRVDVLRLVADDLELHVGRDVGGEPRQALLHALDHRHRVLARLPADLEDHRRHAVEPRRRPLLLGAVFRVADVAHAHGRAGEVGHHEVVEGLRVGHPAHGAQRGLVEPRRHVAAGQVGVLPHQRVAHAGDGQLVRGQPVRIHPHVDRARQAAHDADLADTRRALQQRPRDLVGDLRQLAQRPVARQRDREHR